MSIYVRYEYNQTFESTTKIRNPGNMINRVIAFCIESQKMDIKWWLKYQHFCLLHTKQSAWQGNAKKSFENGPFMSRFQRLYWDSVNLILMNTEWEHCRVHTRRIMAEVLL